MNLPPFIVLETCDGGGGTTQRNLLAAQLELYGVPTLATANPSEGPAGKLLRDMLTGQCADRMDPTAHQMLYVTDRFDCEARVVAPARAQGLTVVCSRWELSTVVYYAAGGATVHDQWQRAQDAFAWHRTLAIPTLTIVLVVSPATAAKRRQDRGGEEEFFDAADFQSRVAELYANPRRLALIDKHVRYCGDGGEWALVAIDGEGSIDEVAARIWAAVLPTVESRIAAGR